MNIIITRRVILNGTRHEIEVPERIVITLTELKRLRQQERKELRKGCTDEKHLPDVVYHWQHEKFNMDN